MKRLLVLACCWTLILVPSASAASLGLIQGTVTPVAAAPETEVCLVVNGSASEECVAARTDGSYEIAAPAGRYLVEFVPSYRTRLLKQYYHQASSLSQAQFVQVEANLPTGPIDADLLEGGAITGIVTSGTGAAPLSEVEVCALSIAAPSTTTCDMTGAAGEYELHSLPTGSYRVGFWGEGASAEYEPWYYQDRLSIEQGTPVAVTAGATTTGVDASLAKGARVEGIVTAAADDTHLGDIAVCLFSGAEPKPRRCTHSDQDGGYSFEGLAAGSYQVGFSLDSGEIGDAGEAAEGDGFEAQYYDGVPDRAEARTIPVLVSQVVAGIDASLARPPVAAPVTPPAVAAPLVATAPPVAVPAPNQKACKKPKKKKEINGKVRCVKPAKKSHPHHHKKKKPHRRSHAAR